MDNRTALWVLHNLEGIGWKTIASLVSRFANLGDMMELTLDDAASLGIPQARAKALIHGFRQAGSDGQIVKLMQKYEQHGLRWITIWDEAYPEQLKQIAQPPWVIYYRGHLPLIRKPCIAVVGTRTPTVYGKLTAEKLAEELSSAGLCVVSGMARGIDGSAHAGALKGSGSTMAVLGCGAEVVYPQENLKLYRQISTQGLVLSEYPLGTRPRHGLFPQRNRIIAGLSLGVVVVEAASRSGSLITADLALEESRDVFAVPGPIHSPKSAGAFQLLKQGAKLVTCAEDILEEYPQWILKQNPVYIKHKTEQAENAASLTQDQRLLIRLLEEKSMTIDELLVRSQFNFGHLHSVLIHLLMINRIVELPGSVYAIP